MNQFQTTLYNDLLALCEGEKTPFYYTDQKVGADLFRIFLYRLASYTDFQRPNAHECRGHTFRIDASGKALEFVSMPMEKFWNIAELTGWNTCPDLNTIVQIEDKLDGSLISTACDSEGNLLLKSKGSFISDQARGATDLINTPEYAKLKDHCQYGASLGFTVNMEFRKPMNGNVLLVEEPSLRILNVRDNSNGNYVDVRDWENTADFMVESFDIPADLPSWVETVYHMTGIEGFIVVFENGQRAKLKCSQYVALHHVLSNLNSPKQLYMLILNEAADDAVPLIKDNKFLMDLLESETIRVRTLYNEIESTVEDFYEANKHLDRKSFAIKGQAELVKDGVFSLAMNKYIGRPVDVKEYMIKHYDKYKVREEVENTSVED